MDMQKVHVLKILPEYFQAVIEGRKKAEFRINDRNFKVDEMMMLQEWDGGKEQYTGRSIEVQITDVTYLDYVKIYASVMYPNSVMLSFLLPVGVGCEGRGVFRCRYSKTTQTHCTEGGGHE